MKRRHFLHTSAALFIGACLPLQAGAFFMDGEDPFTNRLKPVGRLLELEGYYVWCNSPIEGPDGSIHLFFSRWDAKKGMGGWIRGSEIWHAVAPHPEGPYTVVGNVLSPRPGCWDATTCHNPLIRKVDGRYALFYMGNSNGKTDTKRIGLALADDLYGPWTRSDLPLLEAGPTGAWDDHCTTNPAFLKHQGKYWLYYKSWNTKEYDTATGPIRGNRKYGLAIADALEGPYRKVGANPLIDFSGCGNNAQIEDAFVWEDRRGVHLIARDMGYYNHENGLLLDARDGLHFGTPRVAYYAAPHYFEQPPAPKHLKKYGRFERPQLLFLKGRPAYLFTASQGGAFQTASSFLFKIT
jgi:hypothetical protein